MNILDAQGAELGLRIAKHPGCGGVGVLESPGLRISKDDPVLASLEQGPVAFLGLFQCQLDFFATRDVFAHEHGTLNVAVFVLQRETARLKSASS